jgi:hypothetical protein
MELKSTRTGQKDTATCHEIDAFLTDLAITTGRPPARACPSDFGLTRNSGDLMRAQPNYQYSDMIPMNT